MNRETKIGLLVGLTVIIVIGVLISDHLSLANQQHQGLLTKIGQDTEPEQQTQDRVLVEVPVTPPVNQRILLPGDSFTAKNTDVLENPGLMVTPAPTPTPTPAPAVRTHVVEKGDTLAAIARKYYRSSYAGDIALILEANKAVNPNNLKIGTKLVIPDKPAPVVEAPVAADPLAPSTETVVADPAAQPEEATKDYTVKSGDNFEKLAKRFYGSASATSKLMELNKDRVADPDRLKVGAVIRVPR